VICDTSIVDIDAMHCTARDKQICCSVWIRSKHTRAIKPDVRVYMIGHNSICYAWHSTITDDQQTALVWNHRTQWCVEITLWRWPPLPHTCDIAYWELTSSDMKWHEKSALTGWRNAWNDIYLERAASADEQAERLWHKWSHHHQHKEHHESHEVTRLVRHPVHDASINQWKYYL